MKRLDQIDKAFNPRLDFSVLYDSLVRIILNTGIKPEKRRNELPRKHTHLKYTNSKKNIELLLYYKDCTEERSENPLFKFVDEEGFKYEINLNQIADFDVIKYAPTRA